MLGEVPLIVVHVEVQEKRLVRLVMEEEQKLAHLAMGMENNDTQKRIVHFHPVTF